MRDELQALRASLGRAYLLAIAVVAGVFPLLYVIVRPTRVDVPFGPLAGVLLLLSLSALAALRMLPRRAELAVTLAALGTICTLGFMAAAMGSGVTAPGLGFVALQVAFSVTFLGRRPALLITATGLAVVFMLAHGQLTGWLEPAPSRLPLPLHAALQMVLIVFGAAGGLVVSRVLGRSMRAAEERDQRFSGLLRIAADAYWEMDPQHRLVALSSHRLGTQALGAEAGLGSVPWEQPAFGCEPDVLDHLRANIEARQFFREVLVQWQRPGGPLRHILVSGEPRLDEQGVFLGYWGVVRDVTEDIRARRALVLTETRYRDLFVCIPSPIVLHRSGRVIDANPAALKMFGFPDLSAMVGHDLLEMYADVESADLARERLMRVPQLPAGESLPETEFRLRSRSGRLHLVRATGVAVETELGPAVLSIYVDDTERRAAEDAVRRSEALLSHLVASSPDVITLSDCETGRYAMVNRSFEQLTGWTAEEAIGRTSTEVGPIHVEKDRERLMSQVMSTGGVRDMPLMLRRRDGSAVPMLVSGARFEMDRRDYLVINARDMTEVERGRLEREAILENASLGIALTRDQHFQMVNPAFETMMGWAPGALIGQPGAVVWPTDEAYGQIGRQIGPRLARGEQIEVECEIQRRDGSTFLSRMLARAIDPSHPIRGGTIWVVEDITQRKRLDEALARARDEAEAASRAKSAFLANTSHELRTPLNGLLGLAQLALVPGLDDSRRSQYLHQIVESAQSLAMIVSDILDLSKIEAGHLAIESIAFDLDAMLQSVLRSCSEMAAASSLDLALEVGPALGVVQGDALRVRQILTNYLGNSIKFTRRGRVRLVVRRAGGDRVRFEVHDTGAGIDPTTQARLFTPFTQADESTTRRFGGTGLGLSICRELAGLMGGQVGVTSEPGQGSCFWADLPLPQTTMAPDQPLPPVDLAATQGAHVLLVDDNEINLMVAVAQLEQFGIRVGQASDGRQALDAVEAALAAGDPYELIVMDLQMPVLSGYEVTAELRRHHTAEQLPIVAHTAAALVTERAAALAAGMNDFLTKPTNSEELRATIARWLRRPG